MAPLPHREYAGNHSWFRQWSLYNQGQIEQRKPWHQFVNFQEALDIFKKVERLIKAWTTAQQLGVELDTENKKAQSELLKPDQGQTFEGQKIFFPKLYHKDLDSWVEGELNNSPAPSQTDLDVLSG